ncbi:polysaccharide lyase family 7 protein [Pseudomonas multiresinivorans]|uniref:Polysaccharide lyase family 7 protein n=1 Tax=Pseudomonas multiresinivorans TaxID=95301 RepID=A0A7Z3GRW2_9PSED|nr:polysaccharide lyase family 7 protein [Pseudomonas multiresinivorans]QJP10518.1 polysaccharide lyase family 7 protein [Pseudomonas multiresinivorans]
MIDLSTWNLSVPTDPRPTEVTTEQIARGYQSRYFKRDGSQLVFWVPVTGSHTSDSVYPRSELRETTTAGEVANWFYNQGDNELRVTMSVQQVPSKNKIIIGQIHSRSPYTGDGEPLVKLQYHYLPTLESGRLEALVRNHPDDKASINVPLIDNIALDQTFNYSLRVTSVGNLAIRVETSDGRANYYRKILSTTWSKQLLYFKAGAYINDNYGNSSEGARVTVFHLNMAHR